jgi:hypothetical protein
MPDDAELIVAELRRAVPGLQVNEMDYGFTVGVRNPANGRANYVCKVWCDYEAEEVLDRYEAKLSDVPAMIAYLRGDDDLEIVTRG